jgi:hypothetical protein
MLTSVSAGMGLTANEAATITTPKSGVLASGVQAVRLIQPELWRGRTCETVSDPYYGDSGQICGTLNGNDALADLYWQMLVTFQSYSGGMSRLSLMDAGVYDSVTGSNLSTIGYTPVKLNGNTSAFISTPWFYGSSLQRYEGYTEAPCIFWQNGGIACVSGNLYTQPIQFY